MNNDSCKSLLELEKTLAALTGPEGCPWDKAQTPLTLADYIIEESHELVAAIRSGCLDDVRSEAGDLLFLILFVTAFYQKQNAFSLADALDEANAKMIRRHPHVFGSAVFADLNEQLKEWEKIKKAEKAAANHKTGLFSGLPDSLPALIKAYRIHSKAARAGFTWSDDEDAERQVESEWLEWLDACQSKDEKAMTHELGDMLFSLVELGRRKGIKASAALDAACARFLKRYNRMEELAKEKGVDLSSLPLEEQDEFWLQAKEEETADRL